MYLILCVPICLIECQYILLWSLLCASAVRKGQSCCNDQDISQWGIKTVHYFLVLQNICQGVQGLQGVQSPICKGRHTHTHTKSRVTSDRIWQCFEERCREGKKVKLPLIYLSLWKLPLLLDLQLRNGFSQAARSARLPPPRPQPVYNRREVISHTRCAAGTCCSVN